MFSRLFWGEVDEVLAIEADAVVMDVVGVLIRVAAIGGEDDEAFCFVDMEDTADTPRARGELEGGTLGCRGGRSATHRTRGGMGGGLLRFGGGGGVEEVEVGEAVALGEPEDEAVATKVAAVVVGIADIFLLALLDEGAEGNALNGRRV